MERMHESSKETEFVAQQAAEWVAALPSADRQTRAQFVRWLKESPLHVRETLLALEIAAQLSGIDRTQRIDVEALIARASRPVDFPLATPGERQQAPPRRRNSRWTALAAVVVLLVGGLWALRFTPALDVWNRQDYRTATGELRTITLDDGSLVHLDASSRVRVRFSDEWRDIDLLEGTALFSVAHAPARPFRVHVNDTIVQAVGTQFEVNRRADRVVVAVLEGTVHVNAGAAPDLASPEDERAPTVVLTTGEAVHIAGEGHISRPTQVNAADIGAWRQRRLVFQTATLAEIAAEFARYTRTPLIRIEGETLGQQRFSAIFDANRPQSLVKYLERDDSIVIEDRGDVIVVRPREE
jgi:transmembrane sensor